MDIITIPLHSNDDYNDPKRIVIHAMAEYILCDQGTYDYYKKKRIYLELGRAYHAPEWLRAIGLSAHRLITPMGQMIKCRKDKEGAAHAKGHNTDTLGMEILVSGVHNYASFLDTLKTHWVKPKQLTSSIYVTGAWMQKHSIETNDVVRHSKIDPARKKDPGEGFPWEEFINELND